MFEELEIDDNKKYLNIYDTEGMIYIKNYYQQNYYLSIRKNDIYMKIIDEKYLTLKNPINAFGILGLLKIKYGHILIYINKAKNFLMFKNSLIYSPLDINYIFLSFENNNEINNKNKEIEEIFIEFKNNFLKCSCFVSNTYNISNVYPSCKINKKNFKYHFYLLNYSLIKYFLNENSTIEEQNNFNNYFVYAINGSVFSFEENINKNKIIYFFIFRRKIKDINNNYTNLNFYNFEIFIEFNNNLLNFNFYSILGENRNNKNYYVQLVREFKHKIGLILCFFNDNFDNYDNQNQIENTLNNFFKNCNFFPFKEDGLVENLKIVLKGLKNYFLNEIEYFCEGKIIKINKENKKEFIQKNKFQNGVFFILSYDIKHLFVQMKIIFKEIINLIFSDFSHYLNINIDFTLNNKLNGFTEINYNNIDLFENNEKSNNLINVCLNNFEKKMNEKYNIFNIEEFENKNLNINSTKLKDIFNNIINNNNNNNIENNINNNNIENNYNNIKIKQKAFTMFNNSSEILHIFFLSYNLNAFDIIQNNSEDLLNKILFPEKYSQYFTMSNYPDIYCIGFQETIKLNKMNVLIKNNNNVYKIWIKKITSKLCNKFGYQLIIKESMVGLLFLCYVKSDKNKFIKNINIIHNKTGFKGFLGNKGNITVEFKYKEFYFGISTAHLIAGENEEKFIQRLNELKFILTQKIKNNIFYKNDFYFIFGDLNFRLRNLNSEGFYKLIDQIETNEIEIKKLQNYNEKLFEYDSLNNYLYKKYIDYYIMEKEINFLPTYKLIKNKKNYNLKRVPAWCDRILYKCGKGNIRNIFYDSIECFESDHKPIVGYFQIKL